MKSKFFLIAIALVAVIACTKEAVQDMTKKTEVNENPGTAKITAKPLQDAGLMSVETPVGEVYAGFSITGKLRRGIEKRRRDNKECDCKYCFGVCDVTFDPFLRGSNEYTEIYLQLLNENQTEIYVLKHLDYFETEFGIDTELSVELKSPVAGFPDAKILKLKVGEYSFEEVTGKILINGTLTDYYGRVVVNSAIL